MENIEQQQALRQSSSSGLRRLHAVQDVADVLDCSKDTVYNLIAKGELRGVRVGRCLKVDTRSLDRFIERGGTER